MTEASPCRRENSAAASVRPTSAELGLMTSSTSVIVRPLPEAARAAPSSGVSDTPSRVMSWLMAPGSPLSSSTSPGRMNCVRGLAMSGAG